MRAILLAKATAATLRGRRSSKDNSHAEALADRQFTNAERDGLRLLFSRLDRDEAHGRAAGGFADRLGVVAVALAPLDEGLRILRRDQPDGVSRGVQQATQ